MTNQIIAKLCIVLALLLCSLANAKPTSMVDVLKTDSGPAFKVCDKKAAGFSKDSMSCFENTVLKMNTKGPCPSSCTKTISVMASDPVCAGAVYGVCPFLRAQVKKLGASATIKYLQSLCPAN